MGEWVDETGITFDAVSVIETFERPDVADTRVRYLVPEWEALDGFGKWLLTKYGADRFGRSLELRLPRPLTTEAWMLEERGYQDLSERKRYAVGVVMVTKCKMIERDDGYDAWPVARRPWDRIDPRRPDLNPAAFLANMRGEYAAETGKHDVLHNLRLFLRAEPWQALVMRWRWLVNPRWDAIAQEIAAKEGVVPMEAAWDVFRDVIAWPTEGERLEYAEWCEADW